MRDRAFGTPGRTGSGADVIVRPAFARLRVVLVRLLASLLLLPVSSLISSPTAAQTTAPGTLINNVAQATFVRGNTATTVASNTVATVVVPQSSRSTIQLLRTATGSVVPVSSSALTPPEVSGPTMCLGSSGMQTLPNPVLIGGASIDPNQPRVYSDTSSYHGGEPVFVRVVDPDQNRDSAVRDTIDLNLRSAQSGDTEVIRLTETAVASGNFVGYLQTAAGTAAPRDCSLQVTRDTTLQSSYVDSRDASDAVQAQALIDPTGFVFDSRTGQPVNGARVRIVDAITGTSARVLGDDGVSVFPSEIVTGAQATDSGGTVYSFASGSFRFPVVGIGTYRYEIVPPITHQFPSTADPADLASLPGAPFLINGGSFGTGFVVDAPPAANIDVPLDASAGVLFLQKSTTTTIAGIGDFVQYTLRLENTGTGVPLAATRILDTLPAGLRYRAGSTRVDDARAADPLIGPDARSLAFDTGALSAGSVITLRYVVEVTAHARGETLVNRARAEDVDGTVSNEVTAAIQLRNEINRDRAFIAGRVIDGGCDAPAGTSGGVANVRVYLEDGRYTVTDEEGKYHFEDVPAGSHVVQLDGDTIPEVFEPVICNARTRHAGRAYSQFVDVSGGQLWRADFALTTRKPPEGNVALELTHTSITAAQATLEATIAVNAVAVGNTRLLLMLPEGVTYVSDSAAWQGGEILTPSIAGNVVSFKLGERAANSSATVALQVQSPVGTAIGGNARAVLMFDTPTQTAQRLDPLDLTLGAGAPNVARHSAITRGVIAMIRAPRGHAAAVKTQPAADPAQLPNVESMAPGVDWVLPIAEFNPAITSVKVALRHLPDQTVALSVNGNAVSALNFYGTTLNQARTVALSYWRGVDIPEGTSELEATVFDGGGSEVARLTRRLNYSGGPVRGELLAAGSVLIADGRTRPVVRLKLTDADGQLARPGTIGAFRVDPPHRSWFEVRTLTENQLVATGDREPTYVVGENGIAALELEPTTQTGQVVLHLRFADGRHQEIRTWLKPAARDWILVGLAEGTAAHRTISDNMEVAEAAGLEEGYTDDGRVAFFAKGRIRGDFLLTAAYDSARKSEAALGRLNDVIEPQRYYTLYGDASEQRNEAPSQRRIYVKLEREQFYALFGDFETGLTVTELSRYSRTLNGLRSDYAGEHFSLSTFAARTDQNKVRDELRGDGTSGLYRLTRAPLIIGSDQLRIEVRDRFHTERVIDSRVLARFLDYSIDYGAGTLFFKQPVPSRDPDFNPVFIIVDYETEGASDEDTTAGGRAALRFASGRAEIGASLLHEGAQAGDRDLGGLDARWSITDTTEVRAEVARSDSDFATTQSKADAYVAEVTHVSGRLDGRAYVREQEPEFGLGEQLSTETATRKMGIDGRYEITGRLAVQGEAYRQEQLDRDAEREAASAELRYEDEQKGAGLGLRHVADDVNGVTQESEQAYAQASVDLLDERLRLRASSDFTLSGADESIDFPARSIFGADWRFTPDVTFFGEYEHANGENIASDMTRFGVKAAPWNRAQLQSTLSQEQTEAGPRTFANLGLTQGFQLNERWALDVGLDQSNTIRGAATQPLNPRVPLASGSLSDDFLAAFAGALYRSELWTFTSRAEYRNSDLEQRAILTGGFYREPVKGHAFSMSTMLLDTDATSSADSFEADVRLGWAYRPVESRWIVLDRLDLIYESREDLLAEQDAARIVNNLNANWLIDEQTQLAVGYGARYTRAAFDGDSFSGYSDLMGADLRRDLNERFDLGLHVSTLNSWSSHVHEYALGVDLGISFAKNVWVAVGYNFTGFRDEDFSQNRYTEQGPFIKLRVKADQETFKDLASGLASLH
jgi:uncharacterized repeat protein (TIGR01451 family)